MIVFRLVLPGVIALLLWLGISAHAESVELVRVGLQLDSLLADAHLSESINNASSAVSGSAAGVARNSVLALLAALALAALCVHEKVWGRSVGVGIVVVTVLGVGSIFLT